MKMKKMPLPDYLQNRVNEWLDKDYRYTFYERITLLEKSEPLYKEMSYPKRYANTLKYTLENMSLPLNVDEILVGNVCEVIPTEQEWEAAENMNKAWWADKTPEEIQKNICWFYSYSWLRCRPPWFHSFGHIALDWEIMVSEGLDGFINRANESLKTKSDKNNVEFLGGVKTTIEAIKAYIARYAKEAEKIGFHDKAAMLKNISEGAPKTFVEALQLLWLVVLINQKVCGNGVLNLGRMDKYLFELYNNDIKNGVLTREQAGEYVQEFFLKNNEIMANTDHMSLDTDSTVKTLEVAFDDPNYVIIGGLNADKTGGVNDLSSLMVEAQASLGLKNPFMVVRYYDGIDEDFWQGVCDAMKENATIVIYNDDTMIPALKRYGIEEPEVYNYGYFGCNDPIISGDEGGLRQLWFNLLKPLELAMNSGDYPMEPNPNGKDKFCQYSLEDRMIGIMKGAYYGTNTLDIKKIDSMEKFIEAYRSQVFFLLEDYRRGIEADMLVEKEYNADRFRIEDAFLRGTIENAITWNNGGTKYHKIIIQGSGIANVIDSMYAIEKLVFIDQEYTLSELNDVLKNDWEGYELLRRKIKKMPKFGNDIAEVDKYAKIVAEIFTDAVLSVNNSEYLYLFLPTLSTDRDFSTMGMTVGATADGRKCRETISENQSPVEGMDANGITALLNSVSQVPFNRITGGPLNIRMHPTAVSGENGTDIVAALFKTFMKRGGLQIQLNVVGKDTLIAAKENPDKYKSLCVRVTGYSAFFTQMGEKAQDEMIRRTEQTI